MSNSTTEGQGRLTKAVVTFESEQWRVFSGFPLNGEGDIICPRCDAGIKEIKDEFTLIQHSYLNDMDKYKYYCHCRACYLRWVWTDEAKK